MAFSDLSSELQTLFILNYEYQVKIIILFGFFLLSLFYVFYLYPNQRDTKYLLVGSLRAIMYMVSYLWLWLFWFFFPVALVPTYGIESLLLFLASIYGVIFTAGMIIFVLNGISFILRFFIKFGKVDINSWEKTAIKYNLTDLFKK